MQQPQALWLVADRYFVGDVVGQGGYGMVRRGVDRKTGKPVALKMLSPEAGRDPDVVERMLREQQALVALTGTCAVTAIDLCRLESGAPCLVMEWLEGRDLEQELSAWEAAGQQGSHQLLLSLLAPITDTLDRAHGIGIVHRDIKPANIFITTGAVPTARLLDFGLARIKSATPLTAAGMVMGSPSYIPPETWRGNSAQIDGRADLFSLGVIVFRWLTGKLPFDAPDLVGKMMAVTSGPRPSALALKPDLPRAVDEWVARALAIDPRDRFQSGPELREALVVALQGKALPKPKPASLSKPRALLDAQQAFTAAFRSAAGLLKRFTLPLAEKPTSPGPLPPVSPEARGVTTELAPLPPAAAEAGSAKRDTLWLDSSELVPVAGKSNTLWLDSSELVPVAGKSNTLWLDANELTEVAPQPGLQTQPTTEPAPRAIPAEARSESQAPVAAGVATKAKQRARRQVTKGKAFDKAQTRVTARKQRRPKLRKSSR